MKHFNKTYLVDSINYNGENYYCNAAMSGAMSANNTKPSLVSQVLKKEGRKGVLVNVLSKELKGKTDLHGQPYKPTKWIYTTIKIKL